MEETVVLTTSEIELLKKDLLNLIGSTENGQRRFFRSKRKPTYTEARLRRTKSPRVESPYGGAVYGVEANTQTDKTGLCSVDLFPDEIAALSALFVEVVNRLGSKYLSRIYKDKTLTVRRKEEHSEHLLQLLKFNAWISLLHRKAPEKEEQPIVSCDVGMGNTSHFTRDASRLLASFAIKGVLLFGSFGEDAYHAEPEMASKHIKTRKRRLKVRKESDDSAGMPSPSLPVKFASPK